MKSPASGSTKHGRKYHWQNAGRVDSTQFMNTYGFQLGESINLPCVPAEVLEKVFKNSGNVKTRGQTTEGDEAEAVKLIRNRINVQLLLGSQDLSRSQEGDLVHFAESSINVTETLSIECGLLVLRKRAGEAF